MQHIPSWIIKVVKDEKLTCSRCKKLFKVDDLMSIGIQESSRSPYNDTLCIGMFCPTCKDLTIFELKEMSLIEFAFEVVEQETDNKIGKRSQRTSSSMLRQSSSVSKKKKGLKQKSKITSKEIRDCVKFLRDHNHEDFLISLGMSMEEIKKYSYRKSGQSE